MWRLYAWRLHSRDVDLVYEIWIKKGEGKGALFLMRRASVDLLLFSPPSFPVFLGAKSSIWHLSQSLSLYSSWRSFSSFLWVAEIIHPSDLWRTDATAWIKSSSSSIDPLGRKAAPFLLCSGILLADTNTQTAGCESACVCWKVHVAPTAIFLRPHQDWCCWGC